MRSDLQTDEEDEDGDGNKEVKPDNGATGGANPPL